MRGSTEPDRLVLDIYGLYIHLLRKRNSKENEHGMLMRSGPLLETILIIVQNTDTSVFVKL
jgi:hypothetical protein